MSLSQSTPEAATLNRAASRRTFLKSAVALAGASGVAAAGFPGLLTTAFAAGDSVQSIIDAARTAEEIATTFYYQGIAGPRANNLSKIHNANNLNYFQAALYQEYEHIQLLAQKGAATYSSGTIYFPDVWFQNADSYLAALDGLETAFIGAYLAAIKSFSMLLQPGLAELAGEFLGTECEHRVLGRVTSGSNPPNQWILEKASFATVGDAVPPLALLLATSPGSTGYSLPTGDQVRAAAAPTYTSVFDPNV